MSIDKLHFILYNKLAKKLLIFITFDENSIKEYPSEKIFEFKEIWDKPYSGEQTCQ
jgi:hypothetical protein